MNTEDDISHVYMDANSQNKGLTGIKMLHVLIRWMILIWFGAFGMKLYSNGWWWFMPILTPNRVHVHIYCYHDFLFWWNYPHCTCVLSCNTGALSIASIGHEPIGRRGGECVGTQNLAQVHSLRVPSLNCREIIHINRGLWLSNPSNV